MLVKRCYESDDPYAYVLNLTVSLFNPLIRAKKIAPTPKGEGLGLECWGLLADALLERLKVFLGTYKAVLLLCDLVGDGCAVSLDGILECL